MGYRVRNEHGELHFASFAELKDAYVHRMVEPEDEVLEDGSTHWRKAGSLPKLVEAARQDPPLMQTPAKWYLLAGFVLAVGGMLVYFVLKGILGFIVVYGVALLLVGLFAYLAMARYRKRR